VSNARASVRAKHRANGNGDVHDATPRCFSGGGQVAVPAPVPVAQLVPLRRWRRCTAGASRGAVGRAESGRREGLHVPVPPSRAALAAFLAGVPECRSSGLPLVTMPTEVCRNDYVTTPSCFRAFLPANPGERETRAAGRTAIPPFCHSANNSLQWRQETHSHMRGPSTRRLRGPVKPPTHVHTVPLMASHTDASARDGVAHGRGRSRGRRGGSRH
jgi:hypothetical protein